jgi:hypothetical protein
MPVTRKPTHKNLMPDLPFEILHPSDPLRAMLNIRHVVAIHSPILDDGTKFSDQGFAVEVVFPELGASAVLHYQVINNRRELTEVGHLKNEARGYILASDLSQLRFSEIEAEIDRLLSWEQAQSNPNFEASFQEFQSRPALKPNQQPTPQHDLLQAALLYSGLDMTPDPYPTMADKLGIAEKSCRNKVSKARSAGLLEPTIRGRRNHRLTQKALIMLEELSQNNSQGDS